MRIYKLYKTMMSSVPNAAMYVENEQTNSFFFVPETSEYDGFKKEIFAGKAELEDVDGNLMTAEQAIDFVKTLK
jgi:hypothetical protein